MSSVGRRSRLAGSCVCASGTAHSTTALVQNNVFHWAGETAVCFSSLRCILWNAVPKHSTDPELAGFTSRLWEV